MRDHRDAEVKGLARFLPSTASKTLATLCITAPPSLMVYLYDTDKLDGIESACAGLVLMVLILVGLAIELTVIVSQAKHGRTHHLCNMHPLLSWKWFRENATFRHYLFLASLFCAGLIIGYLVHKFG